jgi:GNAT superfamily N-acetyltransferase
MQTNNNVSYEICWITNPKEVSENLDLIERFFALYEDDSNFPDPDEREDPRFIIERIQEESNDPHTHLMAFNLVSDGETKFIAGCIVEFYPDSACGLVTYVFVDKDYRGLKIGSEQIKVGELLLKNRMLFYSNPIIHLKHYQKMTRCHQLRD